MTTTKKTKPKAPDALPTPTGAAQLVTVGYDVNAILRDPPLQIAVTFDLLRDPGPQLSLERRGYLEFGGGVYYRPTGFDLKADAIICDHVPN